MNTACIFRQLKFLAATSVLVSGCATVERTVEYDESPQIHTSVLAVPDNPRLGDTIDIEISLENVGDSAVELRFNSGTQTNYAVFRDGERVSSRTRIETQIAGTMTVLAGEKKTVTHKLKLVDRFQFAEEPGNLPGYFRGEYEVRAGIAGHGDQYPWALTSFTIRQ